MNCLSEHPLCINPKATSDMEKRTGIFEGNDPFALARGWMSDAEAGELNDPNAMALSTVDAHGMPNARIVLLKSIEDGAFVFYTNYESKKRKKPLKPGAQPLSFTGNLCADRSGVAVLSSGKMVRWQMNIL